MIDKTDSRYKFAKKKSDEQKHVTKTNEQDAELRKVTAKLMLKYKSMWDGMASFRRRRERIKNYERGKQWEDIITVKGKKMTEAQHILNQGKMPLKNNVILQTQNSIVGEFRKNYTYAEAVARTKDFQAPSEMMTAMLQFVSQINDIKELDVADFSEGLRSGLAVQSVNYKWNKKRRKKEMEVVSWNPTRVFLPAHIEDVRGEDIDCLGVLMDMPLHSVLSDFARTAEDERKIREIYKHCDDGYLMNYYSAFTDKPIESLDFFTCSQPDKCRVIQAWQLETEDGFLVHDKWERTLTFYLKSDKAALDALKKERDLEIELNGLDPEQAEIVIDNYTDAYWYVRYLSPFGDILFESRTPFDHNGHPFAIYMSRLVDGEIFSLEESIIDQQRYINRLITLIDFIIGASAKGVLIFPQNAIPKGMREEDILEQWTSYNGVIFANLKPGMSLPTQISSNATNVGANELLAMQLQFVRDISGTHGAMLGREAKSGTAASQYAQEATNARTNIIDTIESFNAFRKRRDYLITKTLPQCYDYEDYIPVVGREYSEEAKVWDNVMMAQLDYYISIVDSLNTEVYESKLNELLTAALQQQIIDFETALEAGRFPFSDRVLRVLQRKKQEAMQQQLQQQAGMMQGQAQGLAMKEAGATDAEVMQAGADAARQAIPEEEQIPEELNIQAAEANPRAMELIQQALGQ